ncbi:MAG: dihydroneopterin aldolase [Candidatus Eremiobacteraeota bacterium]|nr:dihydroneopterin aldolase [Candidatus Eremiobacteraeota bacterium]MBV9647620.1 dihydroneopterin aldolase [Candidatus Eremiobacteraeota bacterium]
MRPVAQIALRGIRAYGRHGADEGERLHPQPIDVDVELEADVDAARSSDALADTIDYAAVRARVVEIVAHSSFQLLERLADAIVQEVMHDERVHRIRITLTKPLAPGGATPAVTLTAGRT